MGAAKKLLKVQQVEIGRERAVIVPHRTWRRIVNRLEELDDIQAYDAAKADSDQSTVEHDELCRMLGESPLRYLRMQSGLTQTQLAKRVNVSQSLIAKVENGDKKLSDTARRKIARILKITPSRLQDSD